MSAPVLERDCVIAGGGPAGMVLGHLLARQGLRVTVLEKHADFFRDFRGDTIHPSTLTVLGELGLRDRFLELPLTRIDGLDVVIDGHRLDLVRFSTLPAPDDFLVLAPQWDLLDFLARESAAYAGYELRMSTEATGLILEGDRVVGVRATSPEGELELRATLTVAADGRHSTLRPEAGLEPVETGVAIDVLWFDLPRPAEPFPHTLGYVDGHGIGLTIPRDDHYQAGLVIPKGGIDALKQQGLAAFRALYAQTCPPLASVVDAITDWNQVKLLSVQIDHLERWWREGFVAIGDAAHAMSPAGGVGVNYAIQDAVALANEIAAPLARGDAPVERLERVQQRRLRPVLRMQRIQAAVHARMARAVSGRGRILSPVELAAIRAAQPLIRRITARVIGRGFLPEHVAPRN
ncbi:MAG: FAD-dependent oxidoreductase [Actinomycetales bacterium]|nr:FAD-dependent oxidoreductase [Actinomycetales bacterium]